MRALPSATAIADAPAQWWQSLSALSPLAVLIAAVVAASVGLLTLRQRSKADMRSEWWSRAQWALDAALSADTKRAEVGLGIMSVLAESELARREELEILTVAWEEPLENAELALDASGEGAPHTGAAVDAPPEPGENSANDGGSR
ncbi:hypothetical protein KIH31_04225 [Paenarthrobacter sp. DKR-5]|uniref:hypothetical protein n=1 Tax=Paenarthrobacter sp. DKR-5 TaxID=2835535 RepID=UPI001BDC4199|nr:hypothetical protein [Paenarthrobacter sp. DKR-5]MBT1001801.1 hypothetical protein [Paenarthrobacter sp. DKR-5]